MREAVLGALQYVISGEVYPAVWVIGTLMPAIRISISSSNTPTKRPRKTGLMLGFRLQDDLSITKSFGICHEGLRYRTSTAQTRTRTRKTKLHDATMSSCIVPACMYAFYCT